MIGVVFGLLAHLSGLREHFVLCLQIVVERMIFVDKSPVPVLRDRAAGW